MRALFLPPPEVPGPLVSAPAGHVRSPHAAEAPGQLTGRSPLAPGVRRRVLRPVLWLRAPLHYLREVELQLPLLPFWSGKRGNGGKEWLRIAEIAGVIL